MIDPLADVHRWVLHLPSTRAAQVKLKQRPHAFTFYLRPITARHARFTPESGHVQCTSVYPLCANSGHRANNAFADILPEAPALSLSIQRITGSPFGLPI